MRFQTRSVCFCRSAFDPDFGQIHPNHTNWKSLPEPKSSPFFDLAGLLLIQKPENLRHDGLAQQSVAFLVEMAPRIHVKGFRDCGKHLGLVAEGQSVRPHFLALFNESGEQSLNSHVH